MIVNVANSGTRDGLYTVACMHQFGSWEITKAAGCSKDGVESRTCRLCEETELKTIPATGIHHLTPWKTLTAPTCEDAGLETRVCSECGSTIKKRKLPPKGHIYTYWKQMEQSTVLLPGYQMRYCEVCEKVQERDIPCLPATITLSTDDLPVHRNQTAEGIRVFLNEGDRIISWRSANPKIASVNDTGQITGHRLGETRITVKTAGQAEKSIRVRVTLFPIFTTGLSVRTAGLKHSAFSLKQGDKQKLEISKYPVTSFNQVTFSVDDTQIARVDPDGTVFALKKGKTRICIRSWFVRKNIELNVQ